MSRIDLNNYEAFVLDFLEGRLSPELTEELLRFAMFHPELQIDLDSSLPELKNSFESFPDRQKLHREFSKDEEQLLSYLENTLSQKEKSEVEERLHKDPLFNLELQAFEKTRLITEPGLHFPLIQELHKTEDDLILNNPVLRYIEKEMDPEEVLAFDKELNTNKPLKLEYNRYLLTRLSAEEDLVFPDKHILYKKNKIRILYNSRTYYAAAAVILLLITLVPLIRVMMPSETLPKAISSSVQPSKQNHPNARQAQVKTQGFSKQAVPVSKNHPVLAVTVSKPENRLKESKTESDPLLVTTDTLKTMNSLEDKSKDEFLTSLPDTNTFHSGEQYVKLDFSHMIPFEEEEENLSSPAKPAKGFWQKATRLAKHVNKLGLKSVDGNEVNNNHYLISFNAMSIEKK